jgi:hypothetical protein
MTGVGPEHTDAIRGVPGKVIVVRPNAVAMIQGHSIILKLHGIIKNVCSPALVHHNASTERLLVIRPHIDRAGRIYFVPGKVIPVDGYVARIGYIHCIFVVKNRIKISDHDIRGVVDLDHISLEICSVHGAAIPVHDNIMFPADLDYTIQFRVGEHIISGNEFDVGIAVYGHVVGNGDSDLGNQE